MTLIHLKLNDYGFAFAARVFRLLFSDERLDYAGSHSNALRMPFHLDIIYHPEPSANSISIIPSKVTNNEILCESSKLGSSFVRD